MRLLIFSLLTVCAVQLQAQQKNIYYPSGFVQYSFQVKEGRLNGEFASYYENGFVKAKGNFAQGQKQGVWKAWDTSGILRVQRSYQDNNNFNIVSEWTKTGCGRSPEEVNKKNTQLHTTNSSSPDDVIYMQRYWKRALPVATNSSLYSNDFRNVLIKGINDGSFAAFSDDRFTNVISANTVIPLLSELPQAFMIKEQHSFSAVDQQMKNRIIGLGLTYNQQGADKTIWIYYPDLLEKASANAVVKGLQNHLFITEIDMTTAQAGGNKPRKIEDNEKILLLLAETDFEAQAWIYLLNKDIAGR